MQVAVAVVDEQVVGMFRHLVEHVRVVHQLGIASGQLDCFAEIGEHLEEEGLSRASVALSVVRHLVVHGEECPGLRHGLVGVEVVPHGEYLVDEVSLLLVDFLRREQRPVDGEMVFLLVSLGLLRWHCLGELLEFLAPVHPAGVDEVAEEIGPAGLDLDVEVEGSVVLAGCDLERVVDDLDVVRYDVLLPHVLVD